MTTLRVYLEEKHESGYYHLNGYLVTEDNGKIRNVSDRWDGLAATSQGNDEDATRDAKRGRTLYAWEVVYRDRGHITAQDLKTMDKTMTTVTKRMDTMSRDMGRPESFGQFLGRFAIANKADGFAVRNGGARGWSYDDSDHRLMSLSDGIDYANGLITAWHDAGVVGQTVSTE